MTASDLQHWGYVRGEHVRARLTVTGGDPGSIAGWGLAFYQSRGPGRPALVARTTGGGGVTIVDAVNRVFEVELPFAITAAVDLPGDTYHWECWRTDPGFEDQVAGGTVEAYPSTFAVSGPPLPFPTPLPATVPQGGTGATSFAVGLFLRGNGTSALTAFDLLGTANTFTAGQVIQWDGSESAVGLVIHDVSNSGSLAIDIGNVADPGAFQVDCSGDVTCGNVTASLLIVGGDIILGGDLRPASKADAAAANGSIYFSTTQGVLVYKDSGGVVHPLY